LDYGLVGDLINAAARVESLTKHYGVLFLITRECYSRLTAPPITRVIDKALVKGKTLPLELLEVKHPFSSERFEEVAGQYTVAFAIYEQGDFTPAADKFAKLWEEHNDPPSRLMMERCRELGGNPPANWTGIYELKTK
jgi:adenylate cyclase